MLRRSIILFCSLITWSVAAQETPITPIEELNRGEFATVGGTVVRQPDADEVLISDGTGRVEVYLGEKSRALPRFIRGEALVVHGWVDDDRIRRPREIYAIRIERADGTVYEIQPDAGRWE